MTQVLYHYTTFGYLEEIIESKYLKVSPWEKKNNIERPALWLTKNPNWENSATKGYFDKTTGESRYLTFEEQSYSFGCVRITIPHNVSFCNWDEYKLCSKEPINLTRELEKIGLQQGSNPEDWYVSFEDVPITEIIAVDFWNGVEWEDVLVEKIEN